MKWLPLFTIILGTLIPAFTPSAQAALTHHPLAATIIGGVVGVVSHFLPSPLAQKAE